MATKTSWRRFFISLGLLLLASPFLAQTASGQFLILVPSAKKPKVKHPPKWVAPAKAPAGEPGPLASETPPAILPDAPPSASLQPFLQSHLDKILPPLGTAAFAQSDLIAGMKGVYAKAMLTAPDARKPAYRMALAVCDATTNAIEERQKAVAALSGAYATRSSESIQPRGGKKAVKHSDKDEANFYEGMKNNWVQNAASLRQSIVALSQREHAAEVQAAPWTIPAPAAGATPATEPTPALAAQDPVVGPWLLHDSSPITLAADNSIQGSWEGTWRYTCTTNAGRNYELRYAHKDWVNYMVLSGDGKKLDGKTRKNKGISASRL